MIVPMSNITVLGLSSQKEKLLRELMLLECVQIRDVSDASRILSQEDAQQFQLRGGEGVRYGEMLELCKKALLILDEHAPDRSKKGLFHQKKPVDGQAFSSDLMEERSAYGAAKEIARLGKEYSLLQNEKNQLENQRENLYPWRKLPFRFESRGTKATKAYAGTFLKAADLEELARQLEELELTSFEVIYENNEYSYVYLVFHRAVENEVKQLLRRYSFNRVRFDKLKGSYADVIADLERQSAEAVKKMGALSQQIDEMGQSRESLKLLYDYLSYRIGRDNAEEKLFATQHMFVLNGYLPEEKAQAVADRLQESFTVSVQVKGVGPDEEDVPTLLRNNPVVAPYETITEMYSTPNYREIDPNAIMAPFYFIFFGMMVSDAGYGLLTALICFFMVWRYKPDGMMGKMLKMIGFGGLSTMFWGIMFGGYFGDTITVVSDGAVTIPPVLFNPLDDPMTLLIISFGLGILHIFVGIGAKIYLCFRRKLYAEGLAHASWIFIISGLPMLLLGGIGGLVGKVFAIGGVVLLILTNGWEEKNIFKKLFKGISGLMDITSYFADILSYSRLLALGLSTGVIAMVVNIMGSLGGRGVVGWILFAAVFVIGHTFNLAINLLGAYVHTSRLQYVEFFGKFFEGGGIPFQPLRIDTKYFRLAKGSAASVGGRSKK